MIFFYFLFITFSLFAEIPQHVFDAREIQENVLPKNNSYRHTHQIVIWENRYICHADCSGFVDALLKHSYHLNKHDLNHWLGRGQAKAKNYFYTIQEKKGFAHIEQIEQLEIGDFIAMRFLPWAGDRGHDTGHIMLVNQLPKKNGERLINNQPLTEWAVEIIDCSRSGHGEQDTRFRNGHYHPGLGKGTAALFTTKEGWIVGYAWSTSEKSPFYGKDERPLAIGRIAI